MKLKFLRINKQSFHAHVMVRKQIDEHIHFHTKVSF